MGSLPETIQCHVADRVEYALFGSYHGLTNPLVSPPPTCPPANEYDQRLLDLRNRIVTILAGAHIKSIMYAEG